MAASNPGVRTDRRAPAPIAMANYWRRSLATLLRRHDGTLCRRASCLSLQNLRTSHPCIDRHRQPSSLPVGLRAPHQRLWSTRREHHRGHRHLGPRPIVRPGFCLSPSLSRSRETCSRVADALRQRRPFRFWWARHRRLATASFVNAIRAGAPLSQRERGLPFCWNTTSTTSTVAFSEGGDAGLGSSRSVCRSGGTWPLRGAPSYRSPSIAGRAGLPRATSTHLHALPAVRRVSWGCSWS